MSRSSAPLVDLPAALPAGEFALDRTLVMTLPGGWRLLSGGRHKRPPVPGIWSLAELADDEVVITVTTRDYAHDPARLLDEITGSGCLAHGAPITHAELGLRSGVRGQATCVIDEHAAYFVAALVVDGPPNPLGVELVAAGSPNAVHVRVPALRSMVSTIRCDR
jgi:hypothetical protein